MVGLLPSVLTLPAVCERVGSPAGEALLEGFKPRPYTELVDGKTMAQVGGSPSRWRACRGAAFRHTALPAARLQPPAIISVVGPAFEGG